MFAPADLFTPAEKYEESVADYNAILRRDAEDIDALYYRGVVYETMGNLEAAIADFTTVLRLDPNHVKASYARGACLNVKGEYAEAISTFLTAALVLGTALHCIFSQAPNDRGQMQI